MQSLPRRLDLRSALIGLGVAASLVFLTSLTVPTPPVKTIRISLDPDPASVVRIAHGETFTVPAKLRLVLKAFTGYLDVSINGERVIGGEPASGLQALEFPVIAQAGDVVSAQDPSPIGNVAFVTGYLAE